MDTNPTSSFGSPMSQQPIAPREKSMKTTTSSPAPPPGSTPPVGTPPFATPSLGPGLGAPMGAPMGGGPLGTPVGTPGTPSLGPQSPRYMSGPPADGNSPMFVPIAASTAKAHGTKRAHKRTYQAMMSGPKMPPLKKKDGEALWRRDIQYDFLHAVFTDPTRAFTPMYPRDETRSKAKDKHHGPKREEASEPNEKVTFAEVYLDAMAHSTKCSRILGEKLLGDRQAGIKIAMVCLLVNWGRMNTTLNFFPEMKTILRTYHPIPSLQTHDTQDYKQLQDAPRLKSILKGACEATNEPTSLKALEETTRIPRTNPINLVFLMSTFSHDVEREMFPPQSQFSYFDLIMDTSKSSASRARAFLWLVWAYLEAPTLNDNSENPYGSHFPVPRMLDKSGLGRENIDTAVELVFGNQMTLQRLTILEAPGGHQANPDTEDTDGLADKDGGDQSVSMIADEKSEFGQGPEKAEKTEKDKSEKTVDVPLIIPKPRLRSAKDRRINEEFNAILRLKRSERKERRLARNNAVRDTWKRIDDLDPLYNSDDDCAQTKANGKSHGICPGAIATGLSTEYSDYGERSLSLAVALRRAAKKITNTDTQA